MTVNARSRALYDRASRVMPAGSTRINLFELPYPHFAATGRGAEITDVDGETRIDLLNNYFALIHGHAHPAITQAVIAQLQQGTCFAMPTEWDVRLAEEICGRVPSVEEVRFTNSGSEAVIVALKAARAYTGRSKIAKLEGAYHGLYDYVEVSLGSTPEIWGADLPAAIPYAAGTPKSAVDEVVVLPFNDVERTLRALEPHRNSLAAVLLDLHPNRIGMIWIEPDYLRQIAAFCRAHGILLLVDEIVTLRLARGGAQSRFDLRPDITIMGKIIGGGFPVGAVGGPRRVMSVFDPRQGKARLAHGGTFTANPITMTAGHAAMSLLTDAAIDHVNRLGDILRQGIQRCFEERGVVGQVTGAGSLFRVHLTDRPITNYRSAYQDKETAAKMTALYKSLHRNGVIMSPNCSGALSTPTTEGQIARSVDAFGTALKETFG